jgi:release factor glutamine methyltransferase
MEREPVQYIIGEWDFYGSTFHCRSPILIPRPETEELVELVIAASKNSPTPLRILDVGCGTGAIGISLLKELDGKCASVTAVDVNSKAVDIARHNADRLLSNDARSKYHCLHSSIQAFGEVRGNWNKFDMIVSNPPYIPSVEVPELQPEVAKYEDPIALDGGTDGLDIVRDILHAGKNLFDKNGRMDIWLEVHETHPVVIDSLCTSPPTGSVFSAYQSLGPIKDIYSNYRFNHLRLKR